MKTFTRMLLLAAVMTLFSCEKFTSDEVIENAEANSTLVIRTRAAMSQVTEDAKVSYPVNVYIFNESDACVDVETIASEEDELQLSLPEGQYDVYAIGGADASAYELPTKESATKETVIRLKDGQAHGDLMAANNSVTLAYGEENTLMLSLQRKVMMLESVTINNVPGSVTAVSVSVSPLHENILLDGSYSGESVSHTVALTREGVGNTWKSSGSVYLLEAVSSATVKVSFTVGDKIKSYSYLCPEELKANYKINISGTYSGDGVELSGQIQGETWEGTTNVVFDFNEDGSSETTEPGEEDPNGGVSSSAPEIGTVYEGCYVLKRDIQENETVVTLMSLKKLQNLEFTDDDVETVLSENIKSLIEGVELEAEWRLPNKEEIDYILAHKTDINGYFSNIIDTNKDVVCDNFAPTASLFYKDVDNSIKVMYLASGASDEPKSGNATNLRAVATITFPNN